MSSLSLSLCVSASLSLSLSLSLDVVAAVFLLTAGAVERVATWGHVARALQIGGYRDANDRAEEVAQVLRPVEGIVLGSAVTDAPVEVVKPALQEGFGWCCWWWCCCCC